MAPSSVIHGTQGVNCRYEVSLALIQKTKVRAEANCKGSTSKGNKTFRREERDRLFKEEPEKKKGEKVRVGVAEFLSPDYTGAVSSADARTVREAQPNLVNPDQDLAELGMRAEDVLVQTPVSEPPASSEVFVPATPDLTMPQQQRVSTRWTSLRQTPHLRPRRHRTSSLRLATPYQPPQSRQRVRWCRKVHRWTLTSLNGQITDPSTGQRACRCQHRRPKGI